eukprot:5739963-Prymnesium_polylepis.3
MSQGKKKQVPCVLGQAWETYHCAMGPTCPTSAVRCVCVGRADRGARRDSQHVIDTSAGRGAVGRASRHGHWDCSIRPYNTATLGRRRPPQPKQARYGERRGIAPGSCRCSTKTPL